VHHKIAGNQSYNKYFDMLPDTMSGKGIQIHLLVMIKNKESLIARIKVKIIEIGEVITYRSGKTL